MALNNQTAKWPRPTKSIESMDNVAAAELQSKNKEAKNWEQKTRLWKTPADVHQSNNGRIKITGHALNVYFG